MDICHCDWMDKEVGRAIAGQDKVRERAKQRMLGRRVVRGVSRDTERNKMKVPC